MQPLLLLSQVCQHQNRIFFFNHIHQFLIQYQYSLGQSFERSKHWAILALCYFLIYFVITSPWLVGIHAPNDKQQLHMQEIPTPHGSLYSCY